MFNIDKLLIFDSIKNEDIISLSSYDEGPLEIQNFR